MFENKKNILNGNGANFRFTSKHVIKHYETEIDNKILHIHKFLSMSSGMLFMCFDYARVYRTKHNLNFLNIVN